MIPFIVITDEKNALESYLGSLQNTKKHMVIRIERKKEEFSLDQIKEVIKEVAVYQPYKRTYVFEDFHLSSLEAQNAFLKTLEEAPENVQFILCVPSIHSLLPTIVSRAKILHLAKSQNEELDGEVEKALDEFITNPSLSILAEEPFTTTSRTDASTLLMQLILFFRNRLAIDGKSATILKEIIRIKHLIEKNNINTQLAVDNLLIFIKKNYSIK